MVEPIRPKDVVKKVPDEVIEAFNELIQENWNGRESVVLQKAAAARIASKMNVKRSKLFDKGWMDVEPIFRKAGWTVNYDKPGYNETYDAFYVFKKR